MTTLAHKYIVTKPDGRRQNRSMASYDLEIDNPLIGQGFNSFLQACDNNDRVDPFYYLAYIIDEYGDDIVADLADRDEEDLREHVIAIEETEAEPDTRRSKDELKELISDANPAELENIVEAAQGAKEDTEVDDVDTHSSITNHGGDDE